MLKENKNFELEVFSNPQFLFFNGLGVVRILIAEFQHATRLALPLMPRWFDWRQALVIVQPATLIRWHRQGFRVFWRWTSRPGRPPTARAGLCCPPIIKAHMRRSILSGLTDRSEAHPSNGWKRPPAPTRCRPTGPTDLRSCRTSPGTDPTPSSSSGLTHTPAT